MFPEFIRQLPAADVDFSGAQAWLLSSPDGQVGFWSFPEGGSVPAHRHGPQIGVVLSGCVTLTVEGETHEVKAGNMFTLEDLELHSATVAPGTYVIEVYRDADRHKPLDEPK